MPKTQAFDEYQKEYDAWFARYSLVYESELRALKRVLPVFSRGLEVGVGSGLFAVPLGVSFGVEPSKRMRRVAWSRGIHVSAGVAESLPFRREAFDLVLMVTTICFVDDLEMTFKEAFRVLTRRGSLVLGYVDENSPLGAWYQEKKQQSKFYHDAVFYDTSYLISSLEKIGFQVNDIKQTVFHMLHEVREVEPVRDGYGDGSFIVLHAKKP